MGFKAGHLLTMTWGSGLWGVFRTHKWIQKEVDFLLGFLILAFFYLLMGVFSLQIISGLLLGSA